MISLPRRTSTFDLTKNSGSANEILGRLLNEDFEMVLLGTSPQSIGITKAVTGSLRLVSDFEDKTKENCFWALVEAELFNPEICAFVRLYGSLNRSKSSSDMNVASDPESKRARAE